MRKSLLITAMAFMVLGLVGCGKKEDVTFSYEKNTLVLHEKKGVTEYIVEEFQQDNYVEQELRDQMHAEISSYNGDDKEKITLNRFELADGIAKAIVSYDSFEDYMTFNDTILFAGSIQEVKDAGYKIPDSMVTVADQKKISKAQLLKQSDCKLIVYDGNSEIVPWGQVLYTDAQTTVTEDGKITFNEEGLHVFAIASTSEEENK